jgi:hypothetical protein
VSAWRPPWPGFSARGSLALPLPAAAFEGLSAELAIDGLQLQRKREFHVSLCNRALGARLQAPRAGGPAAARLPALFAALDWSWRASGERWLLLEAKQAGPAHSVVELLHMPAFARFRAQAGELLGEELPAAPAHVTLYVAGDPIGIGIDSQAAFERLRLRRL